MLCIHCCACNAVDGLKYPPSALLFAAGGEFGSAGRGSLAGECTCFPDTSRAGRNACSPELFTRGSPVDYKRFAANADLMTVALSQHKRTESLVLLHKINRTRCRLGL